MNKALIIIGLILGIGGIIFSLLPPEMHTALFGGESDETEHMDDMDAMSDESMHMEEDESHNHHNHGAFITGGLIVAVLGFALTFAGWKIFD